MEKVVFRSGDLNVVGQVYLPEAGDLRNRKFPALLFEGPMTGLKESSRSGIC